MPISFVWYRENNKECVGWPWTTSLVYWWRVLSMAYIRNLHRSCQWSLSKHNSWTIRPQGFSGSDRLSTPAMVRKGLGQQFHESSAIVPAKKLPNPQFTERRWDAITHISHRDGAVHGPSISSTRSPRVGWGWGEDCQRTRVYRRRGKLLLKVQDGPSDKWSFWHGLQALNGPMLAL